MTIHLACDHAGFEHKEYIKNHLTEKGFYLHDHGAFTYQQEDDFPDFVYPCAEAIARDSSSLGIVLGGSGQGEAIVANKVHGIRAAVYYGGAPQIITLSKEHNNANVLSVGARFITKEEALDAVLLWIQTPFSDDNRHKRRIEKIHYYG